MTTSVLLVFAFLSMFPDKFVWHFSVTKATKRLDLFKLIFLLWCRMTCFVYCGQAFRVRARIVGLLMFLTAVVAHEALA